MKDFKQIIKEEWEKEFPESIGNFNTSIFDGAYGSLVERICIRIWNKAVETCADNAEADFNIVDEDDEANFERLTEGIDYEVYVLKESILKFKL